MDEQTLKKAKMTFIGLNLFFLFNAYAGLVLSIVHLKIWGIIMALIFVVLGYFGYYAADKENYRLIRLYKVIIIVLSASLICLFIAFIVALCIDKKNYAGIINDVILNDMYKNLHKQDIRKIVDTHQIQSQCCGTEGPYVKEVEEHNGARLMHTCCKATVSLCIRETAYTKGCTSVWVDTVRYNMIMGAISVAFDACILVIAVYLGHKLLANLRSQ